MNFHVQTNQLMNQPNNKLQQVYNVDTISRVLAATKKIDQYCNKLF